MQLFTFSVSDRKYRFRVNSVQKIKIASSAFSKILKLPEQNEDDLSKNCLNQTCEYWLITSNQPAICIETNIF